MDTQRAVQVPLEVRRYAFGSWTVLRVEGELDLQVGPFLDDLLGPEVRYIAFELDGVTFVDAGGLGMLLGRGRRAQEAGGVVQLVTPSAPVRQLMRLTRWEGQFPTIYSADLAVSVLMARDPRVTV